MANRDPGPVALVIVNALAVVGWELLAFVGIFVSPVVGTIWVLAVVALFLWYLASRLTGTQGRRRRVAWSVRPLRRRALARILAIVPVMLIGLAGIYVLYPALAGEPPDMEALEKYFEQPLGWLLFLGLGVIQAPLVEEYYYRGRMQTALIRRLGTHRGILVTSIVFSLAHFDLYGAPFRLLIGVVLGYAVVGTRSIWAGAILHAAVNAMFGFAPELAPELMSDGRLLALATGCFVVGTILVTMMLVRLQRLPGSHPPRLEDRGVAQQHH